MPIPSSKRKRKAPMRLHVSKVRTQLRRLLTLVEHEGARVEIQRYGEVVAVIVPVSDAARDEGPLAA